MNTPSSGASENKKRVATSPLDLIDQKKSRTLSGDSVTSEMVDKVEMVLNDDQMKVLADMMCGVLETKMSNMVKTIMNEVVKDVNTKMSSIERENSVLKDRVKQLENRVDVLEKQGDTSNQYSRRNCLRVSGIRESDDENMDEIFKKLATELGADVDTRDIDNMHRLRHKKSRQGSTTNQRPRDIIIKFTTYRARQKMLTRRSQLKHSKVYDRVFINEELTKLRGEVFYQARLLVKSKKIKSTWTANGVILVKDQSDVVHRCEFKSDLAKFE